MCGYRALSLSSLLYRPKTSVSRNFSQRMEMVIPPPIQLIPEQLLSRLIVIGPRQILWIDFAFSRRPEHHDDLIGKRIRYLGPNKRLARLDDRVDELVGARRERIRVAHGAE